MVAKVSIFFEMGSDGWSEVLYNNTADVGSLIPVAGLDLQPGNPPVAGTLQSLLVHRLAMLDKQGFIRHVRCADLANPFQYVSADFDSLSAPGSYAPKLPGAAAPPAETWSDVLVELRGGADPNIHHGRHFIRGIPEPIVTPPQTLFNEPGFTTAFGLWRADLIAAGGGWILWSRPNKLAALPILGFGVEPNAHTAWLQASAFPVPGSIYIAILRGIKTPRGWNGNHSAQTLPLPAGMIGIGGLAAGNAVRIGPTRRAMVSTPTWDTQASGSFQVFIGVQTLITEAHLVRITTHKVGRPFGQPVGRRSRP